MDASSHDSPKPPGDAKGTRWALIAAGAVGALALAALAGTGAVYGLNALTSPFGCPSDAWVDEATNAARNLVASQADGAEAFVSDCDDDRMVTVYFGEPDGPDVSHAQVVARAIDQGWEKPTRGSCRQKTIDGVATVLGISVDERGGTAQLYPGRCPSN
jgi:hypothetical protein